MRAITHRRGMHPHETGTRSLHMGMGRALAAARNIVRDYAAARDQADDLAEGFALLDLVQGGTAPPRHPAVADLVALVRGAASDGDDPLLERWYAVYFTAYRRLQRALFDP